MPRLKIFDAASGLWVFAGGGDSEPYVGPEPPIAVTDGKLWWDTDDTSQVFSNVNPGALATDSSFTSAFMQRTSGAGAPFGSGLSGALYYDTTNKRLYRSDGVGWIIMAEPEQTFTPGFGGTSQGNGTLLGTYHRSDGWCDFQALFNFGSTSGMGPCTVILPISAKRIPLGLLAVSAYDQGNVSYPSHSLGSVGPAVNSVSIYCINTANPKAEIANFSGTVPFTWASGDQLEVSGRYQMNTPYL